MSVRNHWVRAAFVVMPMDLQYLTCSMEHTFTCPSCGEEISMVLDLSVSRHTYIEDCEVCCNPIEIGVVKMSVEIF